MKKYLLIACLFVGCAQRGTKNNPILLYDSSQLHYIVFKDDPGSTQWLNLNSIDNLIHIKDSTIKALRDQILRDSLKKLFWTEQFDSLISFPVRYDSIISYWEDTSIKKIR